MTKIGENYKHGGMIKNAIFIETSNSFKNIIL